MGRIADPLFIPQLIPLLDHRVTRDAAGDALVSIGSVALDTLEQTLLDEHSPARLRRQIPLVIASFGSQRAANLLCNLLVQETDGAVRYRVLRGLGRMVTQYPVKLRHALIADRMTVALREHLRVLALHQPLRTADEEIRQGPSAMLLEGLLEDKARQALGRASRMFHLLHPKEDVRGVFSALESQDRRVRASAQEFLDALAQEHDRELRDLLRLVTDDLDHSERVERARPFLDEAPDSIAASLRLLLNNDDDALAAMAAYHALALREPQMNGIVKDVIADRPSLKYVTSAAEQLQLAATGA